MALVRVDMRWLDPFTAMRCWAIDAILRVVLLVLSVPENLELATKQIVNMLQRNVIICTASRRHVSWVFDRHLEHSYQAVVTHAMTASQVRRLGRRYIIATARKALDQS